jgi:two-component system cell cycle sensor histidine kinase/response regulator CckA
LRHQLLHAQKMEALGTLVGGIAHDFNNLLTIILGYSELLLIEKREDDSSVADLKKVIEAASSGAALVQRMLTFSEQTEAMLGPLNLNGEIESMKTLLSRTVPKNISFDLRLSEDLASIDGDAGQIQQVIMNLALNAVDAMPGGGKLTIETKNTILEEDCSKNHSGIKPGNYVLLAVSDNGRGMGNETMERMYDPFFTTKNRDFTKGTGLGLAIVHGIVQGHGGRITCSSEFGKGTRFELFFPALSSKELIGEESAENSTGATPSAHGSETILLVDDDEMVRDLGVRILKKAGYKALTASNGKEGLAVYERKAEKIALVILDLIMPEMGGEQCLEEILKISPKAKILISTGYSSSDEMTRMRIEALASGFVAKPFALSDMLRTVREILDRN